MVSAGKNSSQENSSIELPSKIRVWGVFAVWATVVTVPLALFAAAHMTPLPAAQQTLISDNSGAWSVTHVLAEDCACSRSVLDYLQERGPLPDVTEKVLLVGGSSETFQSLTKLGFSPSVVDAEELCQSSGAEGVPFFQVADDSGRLQYSGAYFDTRFRGREGFLDQETLTQLKSGNEVVNRPVYGCPTSERYRKLLDPFGIKRWEF